MHPGTLCTYPSSDTQGQPGSRKHSQPHKQAPAWGTQGGEQECVSHPEGGLPWLGRCYSI